MKRRCCIIAAAVFAVAATALVTGCGPVRPTTEGTSDPGGSASSQSRTPPPVAKQSRKLPGSCHFFSTRQLSLILVVQGPYTIEPFPGYDGCQMLPRGAESGTCPPMISVRITPLSQVGKDFWLIVEKDRAAFQVSQSPYVWQIGKLTPSDVALDLVGQTSNGDVVAINTLCGVSTAHAKAAFIANLLRY
jgi:hypothetical protein